MCIFETNFTPNFNIHSNFLICIRWVVFFYFMLNIVDLPSSFIEKNFGEVIVQQQHQQPCEMKPNAKEKEAIRKIEKLERTLSKSSIDNNPIFMIYTKCESVDNVKKVRKSLWRIPIANRLKTIWWIYTWPIKCILTITIPNPKTFRRLYPLTFLMCILWIGLNAYMIVWMLTVIGMTRRRDSLNLRLDLEQWKYNHIFSLFFWYIWMRIFFCVCGVYQKKFQVSHLAFPMLWWDSRF